MKATKLFSDNKSGILSLIACVGVGVTAFLSAKAMPKAEKAISDFKDDNSEKELTFFGKVKVAGRHFIAPIISGAATIGCILGAQKVNNETIIAMTGAAGVAAKKYDDYRKANIKVNGKEAHDRVMEELAVQHAKESNIVSESLFEMTSLNSKLSKEEFLFFDDITGQYFTSSLAQVLDAINALNRNFTMGHPEVDVQMWCDFLGIENKKKDNRGWVLCDDYQWIDFDITDPVELEDGIEVITITPMQTPIKDYLDYDWMLDSTYA
jgi:hypothetical protein